MVDLLFEVVENHVLYRWKICIQLMNDCIILWNEIYVIKVSFYHNVIFWCCFPHVSL